MNVAILIGISISKRNPRHCTLDWSRVQGYPCSAQILGYWSQSYRKPSITLIVVYIVEHNFRRIQSTSSSFSRNPVTKKIWTKPDSDRKLNSSFQALSALTFSSVFFCTTRPWHLPVTIIISYFALKLFSAHTYLLTTILGQSSRSTIGHPLHWQISQMMRSDPNHPVSGNI